MLIEQFSNDPKFEGLNPGTAVTKCKCKKVF